MKKRTRKRKKGPRALNYPEPHDVWMSAAIFASFAELYEKGFTPGPTNSKGLVAVKDEAILRSILALHRIGNRFGDKRIKFLDDIQVKAFTHELRDTYSEIVSSNMSPSRVKEIIRERFDYMDDHLDYVVTPQFIKEKGGPSRAARFIAAGAIQQSHRNVDNIISRAKKKDIHYRGFPKLEKLLAKWYFYREDEVEKIMASLPQPSLTQNDEIVDDCDKN